MENVVAVIGAGFGDEGKGLTTDYYADKYGPNTVVVRFQGASQAAHTVETPSGERHVFSHIGSGSFTGADTFLSRYFVVNPITFRREIEELSFLPRIFVDWKCLVTTPYDMILNQLAEMNRKKRHGSCGVGFNETIHRSWKIPVTARDLTSVSELRSKLKIIRDTYFPERAKELGITNFFNFPEIINSPALIDNYVEDCAHFRNHTQIEDETILETYRTVLFEGAQGLLLREDGQFFPHVTRSKPGLTNVAKICSRLGIGEIDVTYVMRAYTTRHGVGPLPYEIKGGKPYPLVFDKTNGVHEFQGPLRFSYLNLDLLSDEIVHDINIVRVYSNPKIKLNLTIMITCVDQISDPFYYIWADEIRKASLDEAKLVLYHNIYRYTKMEAKFLQSRGPTRETIAEWDRKACIRHA